MAYVEESGDLADFRGFFRDNKVKELFDTMMKHFNHCIKKKVAKQKEIEQIFARALTNFKCTEVEQNLIKKYISDTINRTLGYDSSSGTFLNSGNEFFNQQQ